MAENRIAVSYIRWSSGRQRLGDSKERQLQKTKEYCATHKLTLDLQLVDDGKSAYKGKHIAKGGDLERFKTKLEKGELPKNIILIVESIDRLSRQTVPEAMSQFLQIINHGVEVVTLVDGQRYDKKSLARDSMPLMMSMVYMMRAHDESAHKAYRLGLNWKSKRKKAIESNIPMTSICPGWLHYDKDKKAFEVIPDRVERVKQIYELWCAGCSRQHIAKRFNEEQVPHWGKKQRKTAGWHHSYIDKILHTRTVLGEFIPHSTKDAKDDHALAGPRKPVAGAIKGYYPSIIPEALYNRAQARCSGPKGPIGHKCANLFQGLLKDGENPQYTMYYRDHNPSTKWQYVVSDHRRVHPKSELFSWNYGELEKLLLNYITDLDWSTLTSSKTQEVKMLRERMEEADGKLKVLNKESSGILELAKLATNIPELAAKLKVIEAERNELRQITSELRSQIKAREDFVATEGRELIRQLVATDTLEARFKLREAIRVNIKRIDLFRQAPAEMVPDKMKDHQAEQIRKARAVKLTFSNDAIRWITVRDGAEAQLDGKMPAQREIVRDETGGVVRDKRAGSKLLHPIKKVEGWQSPPTITKAVLARAAENDQARKRKK